MTEITKAGAKGFYKGSGYILTQVIIQALSCYSRLLVRGADGVHVGGVVEGVKVCFDCSDLSERVGFAYHLSTNERPGSDHGI